MAFYHGAMIGSDNKVILSHYDIKLFKPAFKIRSRRNC